MKKLILLISSALFVIPFGFSQTFVLGHSDPSNDNNQELSPDAKHFYHAFDIQEDSLWFKMTFYERIDNISWNAKIALDTNFAANTGGFWQGQNQSIKYDILLDIYFNPSFPPPFTGNVLDASDNYISSNISLTMGDTSSFIAAIPLSQFSSSISQIDVIASCGIVFGSIDDEIPDNERIEIAFNTTGIMDADNEAFFNVFPNPTNGDINLELISSRASTFNLTLNNILGRTVFSEQILSNGLTTRKTNLSSLKKGIYILKVENGGTVFSKKILLK